MKFPLLVLLAAGALSAPFNNYDFVGVTEPKCDNPRRLAEHATSLFEYEGETLSTIQGSTPDSTGIRVRARIYIHPQGACRYSMQINNAELQVKSKNTNGFSRAAESAKFARALEANNILFEVSSGRIERLFPSHAESNHILNIKRGILSTLQLEEKSAEEVDVNGRCKASITKENGMTIKTKDLSECSDRTHNEIGLHTASFENKEMPVKPLNSTSRCVFRLDDDKIFNVQCSETHIFRPFSAGFEKPSGAITFVKQTMQRVGQKEGSVAVNLELGSKKEGVSMAFEHDEENIKPDNSIVARIEKVMVNLVSKDSGAKKESAHEFTHLVSLLRKVDKKRMTPIMEQFLDCEKGGLCTSTQTDLKSVYRQYFLDALTYCATPTCVSAVHDIIIQDGITGESKNMFLQGISLVAKPTKGMIRDVKEIAAKKPSRQAFLTLGILMYRYCSANPDQCIYSKTNPITHAEILLEDKLGNGCSGQEDSERVEEILMALKAIGNAGRPFRAWTTLLKCAKTAIHQNITASALEALRRMPCNNEVQERLFDMFENVNMNPEKRIQTYIALMRCPSEGSIQRIVRDLNKEGSKQVGSFMWSHLKNINESSDARHAKTKEYLAMALKTEKLKEFDLPFTRYSKAFEGSVYSKFLKSGGSVDGHLIYNPDSILPRSALLNVTANILDVPVNVFEMAARVEGIETLMADLFGPDGQFPDNAIVKIFNFTFSAEDRARLRSRRSTSDNINDNIKRLDEQVNKKRVEPSGSLSMKVLGNEIKVFSYDDIFWAVDQIDNMNVIDILLKVARGGKKTFTKSVMFMEMTHSVPTGLGFPLKLNLKGSSVASLELEGKFDIRNMFWGPRSMEIRGFMKPSAVVDISGRMGVSSHYIDTGIYVKSSMFTSQMIKGAIAYKEGKLVKLNIDAPEKPVEVFHVSSTPYIFMNEEMQIVKGAPRRLNPSFCLNSKMVLGLGICTSMSAPVAFREYESPFFPLSGPSHFGLKIVKADPKLTTYEFAVALKKKNLYNGYEMIGSYSFGTPGATYSRGMSGTAKYLETDKLRRLTFGELKSKNSVELKVEYQNITNRFDVDLRSNLLTSKMMRLRFLYNNESTDSVKKMGVSLSAEYDWYKFQYTADFKKTENSYRLRSKTMYMPEKYVQAQATYTIDKKDIEVRLEANQFKQVLQMNGRYVVDGDEKGLQFAMKHMPSEKESSLFAGIVNKKDLKKAFVRLTDCTKQDHEVALNYMTKDSSYLVELSAKIMKKTGSVFADFMNNRDGLYGVDFGARYEDKLFRIANTLENLPGVKEACSGIYFNSQTPAKSCLSLRKMSAEVRKLVWSTEILKRVGEVSFELSNASEKKGLITTVKYNTKELLKNTMTFKLLRKMWEAELKSVTEIGQRSIVARIYSENLPNSDIAFGVEAKAFNKMVKLQATYSTVMEEDATNYIMTVEGWINKKLPLKYVVDMKYGMQEMGLRSTMHIRDYRMITSISWKRAPSGKRTLTRFFGIFKKEIVIFSTDISDTLSINGATKFYKNEMRFTIMSKSFRYGWDVHFQNKCTDTTSAYAVTFGLDYAQNRRSAITFTATNNAESAKFVIDFMYIPNRKVSHVISYDKVTRQLDISIEFLPKMFVKLMGRLDKVNGWKLTTDLKFSWSNYERVLTWVTSYVSRTDIKALSFKFATSNKQFIVSSEYNQKTKTLIFTVSALGRSMRLTGYWIKERKLVGLRLTSESMKDNVLVPNEIIEAVAAYSEKYIAVELRRMNSRYAKTVAFLDKSTGIGYLELFFMDKSVAKTIGKLDKAKGFTSLELIIRDKSIVKVQGEVKMSEALLLTRLFVLGKERFQSVAKYDKEQKTAILSVDALRKNLNAVFSAKWNPVRKEITLSTEVLKRTIGVVGRFDPAKYIISMHGFYQKHLAGWTAYYDAKNMAAVYNVTLTPRLSGQVIMQVLKDSIIAVSVERKFGTMVVKEASFQYKLGSDACDLVFHWNKDTTNKIRDTVRDIIVPAVKNAVNKVTHATTKIATSGKTLSIEAATNAANQAMKFIDRIDQSFDNIDFEAIKDKSSELVVSGLKNSAELTNKALQLSSRMLTKVHEKLPEIMEKTKTYARKGVELTKTALKESRVLINEANKIAHILYKIAKNLTESGIPVAKTALRLAKDFKIRGKTMEQIVSDAVRMSETIAKAWKKNLAEKIRKAQIDVIDYLRNMPVPYRKEKLGELYVIYKNKLEDFRATFNWEEKVREVTRKLMAYKIKGMSVAEHARDLEKKAKKLQIEIKQIVKNMPEDAKKMAIKVIGESRVYMKKINRALKKAKAAVQPIILCIRRVSASINKHFGPLVDLAVTEAKLIARDEFTKVYMPARRMITRVTEIIVKFVEPLVKPIKPLVSKIHAQIKAIRILEKEIGTVVSIYVNELKQAVEDRISKTKMMLMERVGTLKQKLTEISDMTPEEIVVTAIDRSIELGIQANKYARGMYNRRQVFLKKWKAEIRSYYAKVKELYAIATSKPVEDLAHAAFQMAGESIIKTLKEFVKTIDQVASMEISKPFEEAWREMDLANHLERYGLHSNLAKVIRLAKDVNLTKAIFTSIERSRKAIAKVFAIVEDRIRQASMTVDGVYKYVRSIPKKSFDDFYQEIEELYTKNQELIYNMVKKMIIEGKVKLNDAVETAKKTYKRYVEAYYMPAKVIYGMLRERAALVYRENYDECSMVFSAYADILKGLAKEKYAIARKYVEGKYLKLRTLAEKRYEMIRSMAKAKYEEYYQKGLDFYRKYEDRTWEMIADELYELGERYYQRASDRFDIEVQKARVHADKAIAIARKYYAEARRITDKYIVVIKAKYENVIKPEALRLYARAMKLYSEMMVKVKKTSDEYYKLTVSTYRKAYVQSLAIYNANKDLSIRQLYKKIVALIYKKVNEQVQTIKELTKKQYSLVYSNVHKKVMQLKEKAEKIRAEVMPIVLFEAESIFNQTLRASVVLANETVKAYTPHYYIVKSYAIIYYGKGVKLAEKYYKDAVVSGKKYYKAAVASGNKYYAEAKVKSMDLYKKAIAKTEMQIKEITEYIKQLLQKIYEHPRYKQVIEHKYTKQAIKMLKEYKEKLEPKISELKLKVAELRTKIEPKIAELKAKIEELKNHPKVIEMKLKIADYRKRLMALREHEYVLKAIEILKQMRESGLYTMEQLRSKVSPYIEIVKVRSMEVPDIVVSHAVLFRRDPAECVWTIYGKSKSALESVRSYDWKSVDVRSLAKEFIADVTDERTKEAAKQLVARTTEGWKRINAYVATLPKIVKKRATDMYERQVAMIKNYHEKYISAWKRCPLYPIVNHEVWGEIVAEVVNHEIITETSSFAKQTAYVLDIYGRYFVKQVKKSILLKVEKITARYNRMVLKVNSFLDETTLEDIVNKAVESYEITKAKIEEQRQILMGKLNKAYGVAKERYTIYREKAMVIGKKYYAKAEKIWREKYPKIEAKARAMYMKAKQRFDKLVQDAIKYSKDMKEKVLIKSMKIWMESELRRNLITLKGMTVGETVAEIKALPRKARALYGKALKVAQEKMNKIKARYDEKLKPHVQRVEKIVRAVFEEVNATAVFVYRYYDLRGNMFRARDYLNKRMIEAREYVKDNAKKYKEIVIRKAKEIMPKIAPTMQLYAKKLAKASIKSVHSSLVFVDNIDVRPYINKIKSLKKYVPDINKYVMLDADDNLLIFRIPHYAPIEPSFSYQINKIDRFVRNTTGKITAESVKFARKMVEYARNKIEYARKQTEEIRADLNTSVAAHTVLGRYMYSRAASVSSLVWKYSVLAKDEIKEKLRGQFDDAKNVIDQYSKVALKKGTEMSKAVAQFTKDAVIDVTYSNGIGQAYNKAEKYTYTAVRAVIDELKPLYAKAKVYADKAYKTLIFRYKVLLYKTRPYYIILKDATEEWRNGAEFRHAFRVVEVQLRKAYTNARSTMMEKFNTIKMRALNTINPEDVAAVQEYLKVNQEIARKYAKRLFKLYITRKVKFDRAVRHAKNTLRKFWERQPASPFTSTAMIFGKNHVMTFDGKFYDIPKFPKSSCTYLLARDFINGKFTVLSQKENLIVQTPDMEVIIHQNGRVTSSVKVTKAGRTYKKVKRDLPVQSETGLCVWKKNVVQCEFKQGLKVRCHNDRLMCTISLSSWHYGKSQGLLGTNNNELYDDFKLPDNTITDSVSEFVNSWLVTRSGRCVIKEENNAAPLCSRAPSERCFELFKSPKSPFAPYFKSVDPLPFLKACLIDTADCETKQHRDITHCNVTSAYRRVLKLNGYRTRCVEDCLMFKKKDGTFAKIGEKWVEPVSKDVDVVVLVSERAMVQSLRRNIALSMFYVERRLNKQGLNTRFALVGFGGDNVHEEPHLHTMGGNEFSDIGTVTRKIKEMPYTGEVKNKNDAYAAIAFASNLRFRTGARKVFILFNFDKHVPCFFGPTFDETVYSLRYKANATFVVFDKFDFKPYKSLRVIGQSESRVYLSPYSEIVSSKDIKLPRSSFTKLVRISDGAMFINKFSQDEVKMMTTAVSDAVMQPLKTRASEVQCCKLKYMYPKCRISDPLKC